MLRGYNGFVQIRADFSVPTLMQRARPQPQAREAADAVTLSVVPTSYYDARVDANARENYYDRLLNDRSTPTGFTIKLTKLIQRTHTRELGYFPDKYLYGEVDRHPDGTLRDIYTGTVVDPPTLPTASGSVASRAAADARALATPHANPIALALQPPASYNCEHVVARDWFHDRQPMRGDLHNLFTADALRNSARGSASLLDDPPPAGRGAMARATLYMLLRYPHKIDRLSQSDVETLKQWSREEPPSDYERHRNVEIQKRQGNRNPFIDRPDWVDRVVFS